MKNKKKTGLLGDSRNKKYRKMIADEFQTTRKRYIKAAGIFIFQGRKSENVVQMR